MAARRKAKARGPERKSARRAPKPLTLQQYLARYGVPPKGHPRRAAYERTALYRERQERAIAAARTREKNRLEEQKRRERAAKKRGKRRRLEHRLKLATRRGDRVAQLKALHALHQREIIKPSKHRFISTVFRQGILHAFRFRRVLTAGIDITDVVETVRRWALTRTNWRRWLAVAFLFSAEKVTRDVATGSPKTLSRLGKTHPEVSGTPDSTGEQPSPHAMCEELEELLTGWLEAAKRHDEPIILDWVQVSAWTDRTTAEQARWLKKNRRPLPDGYTLARRAPRKRTRRS